MGNLAGNLIAFAVGLGSAVLWKLIVDALADAAKKAIDPVVAQYLTDSEYWDAVDRWLDQTYNLGSSVLEALREQGIILSQSRFDWLVKETSRHFDWQTHFAKARHKAMTIDQLNNQL